MVESTDDDVAADERERAFAEGDLGTIQSILFGSQAKQFEERMAALELRMQSGVDQARTELEKDLETSERRVQGNLDSAVSELRQAVEQEHAHRLTSIDELEHRHRESTKELLEGVALRERDAQSQRETIAELLENTAEQLRNGLGGTPDHQ